MFSKGKVRFHIQRCAASRRTHGDDSVGKHLLPKHKNLSSTPPRPCRKSGTQPCILVTPVVLGDGDRQLLGAHWPAGLAEILGFGFGERPPPQGSKAESERGGH